MDLECDYAQEEQQSLASQKVILSSIVNLKVQVYTIYIYRVCAASKAAVALVADQKPVLHFLSSVYVCEDSPRQRRRHQVCLGKMNSYKPLEKKEVECKDI